MFNIFTRRLTRAQSDAVNAFGWEVAKAYADLGFPKEESADQLVISGAIAGCYMHGWTVHTDSVEQAFNLGNQSPANGDDIRHKGAHSASVGDVFINDRHEGWLCLPMGWAKLSHETVMHFECMVPQHMGLQAAYVPPAWPAVPYAALSASQQRVLVSWQTVGMRWLTDY